MNQGITKTINTCLLLSSLLLSSKALAKLPGSDNKARYHATNEHNESAHGAVNATQRQENLAPHLAIESAAFAAVTHAQSTQAELTKLHSDTTDAITKSIAAHQSASEAAAQVHANGKLVTQRILSGNKAGVLAPLVFAHASRLRLKWKQTTDHEYFNEKKPLGLTQAKYNEHVRGLKEFAGRNKLTLNLAQSFATAGSAH